MRKRTLAAAAALLMLAAVVANLLMMSTTAQPIEQDEAVTEKLALDVIERWLDEKDGETEVGRVLPREYLFFTGDGKHNHFRKEWDGGQVWDWSLQSPYEE